MDYGLLCPKCRKEPSSHFGDGKLFGFGFHHGRISQFSFLACDKDLWLDENYGQRSEKENEEKNKQNPSLVHPSFHLFLLTGKI